MSIPRIFVDLPLTADALVDLPEGAARHVARVLRMRSRDPINLFNGQGGEYSGRIVAISSRGVRVALEYHSAMERESPLRIVLAQGISRGERMDLTLQKATELGVSEVVPQTTHFTGVQLDEERREKRLDHWRRVIASACEQCGRNRLPELKEVTDLNDWVDSATGDLKVALVPEGEHTMRSLAGSPQSITVVVGPEGGLSRSEQRTLHQAGFLEVGMGPRILRTETAGMAAVAALQSRFGDL